MNSSSNPGKYVIGKTLPRTPRIYSAPQTDIHLHSLLQAQELTSDPGPSKQRWSFSPPSTSLTTFQPCLLSCLHLLRRTGEWRLQMLALPLAQPGAPPHQPAGIWGRGNRVSPGTCGAAPPYAPGGASAGGQVG